MGRAALRLAVFPLLLQQHAEIDIGHGELAAQKGDHAVAAAPSGAKVQRLIFGQQYTGVFGTGLLPRGLQQLVRAVVVIGLQLDELQGVPVGIV